MAQKRSKLGIVFNFSSNWMGGIIYILNLIRILDFLEDEEKPEITLFCRKELLEFTDKIYYPYLTLVEWSFPPAYLGYFLSWITRKNIFINRILESYDLDGLYPLHDYPVRTHTKTKLVCWYADLQQEYYPEFFTRRRIIERRARIRFMLRNSNDLVASSQAVADDFVKFFSIRDSMKIHIFHFASVLDDFGSISFEDLRHNYKVPLQYFMVSNQFHPHKNHKVLLEAMVILKAKGIVLNYVFTGRFANATHTPSLKEILQIVEDNSLQSQIRFLGVIPRVDQLLLMKHSQAVLQPTLFEGWSTVIEDAISLQVPVIASNIPVNIEQLGKDGVYFNPHNPSDLAAILFDFPQRNLEDIFYEKYEQRIMNAAKAFVKIFT